jgi:VIT1/CCC1 family predicted Fe2+/Mn2+ transporter
VHARDEPGQKPDSLARWRSAFTFVSALGALGVLGSLGARAGGAPSLRAAGRVILGGGLAMVVTTLVGRLAGAAGV